MFTAKQILIILAALLLGVGAALAQICVVTCSFQGTHQAAPPAAIEQPTGASGHCHGQAAEPSPQEQKQPQQEPHEEHPASDCLPHEYAGAALKSGASSTTETLPHVHLPRADLYLPLSAAFDRLADEHARAKSYRAPPTRAFTSVLRI